MRRRKKQRKKRKKKSGRVTTTTTRRRRKATIPTKDDECITKLTTKIGKVYKFLSRRFHKSYVFPLSTEITKIAPEGPLPLSTLFTTAPSTVSTADVTTENDVITTEPMTTDGGVSSESIADGGTATTVTPSDASSGNETKESMTVNTHIYVKLYADTAQSVS